MTSKPITARIGLSICYEDAYGVETIAALPEADLLINGSNDAWFGDSFAPHQHLEIARLRALETGRYLLRATNTGVSAIIDSAGDVVVQSPQFRTHVLSAAVRMHQGLTPFARYGRGPILGLTAFMLGLAVLLARRAVGNGKS